ncbi:TerC family protein [Alkalicoccus urumqiensis]|uniref:TerC family protein n=1 Tax=Alkalicoccus urumqiensis TaxID=1548213 RepID=A0A2P6MLN4_ALKUR|nr:TerC family protein [Alkalicoccus urumqiensis]PRO67168.1 hypothetical protein C6I21_01005 [Alkalicoccus urumqiensis]
MTALLVEYGWTLLVLIGLEGLLAADNALVLAMMVRHLPEKQRKKALFYGLAGAFVFRFASLFMISFLIDVWQVQAIGALYLLFLAVNHFLRRHAVKKVRGTGSGFWSTVFKVELADVAFAVDSILAAVALAVVLPETGLPPVGGMDGGQFAVILTAGLTGIVLMRFAAHLFIGLLEKRPQLEHVSYIIVGWVGVKLLVYTLAHPDIHVLDHHFPHSVLWKSVFWAVLLSVFTAGLFWHRMPWYRRAEDGKVPDARSEEGGRL